MNASVVKQSLQSLSEFIVYNVCFLPETRNKHWLSAENIVNFGTMTAEWCNCKCGLGCHSLKMQSHHWGAAIRL